jgi:hypothetical protein
MGTSTAMCQLQSYGLQLLPMGKVNTIIPVGRIKKGNHPFPGIPATQN